MKNKIFISFIFIFIIGCGISGQLLDDEFYSDLGSENARISSTLFNRYFNKNLDTLNYDYYLNFLKKDVKPAEKNIIEVIEQADTHYFKSQKYSFMIMLLYKKDHVIVCDNSGTTFVDSVITFKEGDKVPSFDELAIKLNYK